MKLAKPCVLAVLVAASGCVHHIAPFGEREPVVLEPILPPGAHPDPATGYLAVAYDDAGAGKGYGLGFVDAADREFLVSFALPTVSPGRPDVRVAIIAVPPADYRVPYWLNPANGKGGGLEQVADRRKAFAVRPGHVVLLGRFLAGTEKSATHTKYSIERVPLAADDARAILTEAYREFENAPLECVLCVAPRSSTAPSAAPPLPVRGDFAKEHDVVLHVHRSGDPALVTLLTAWEPLDESGTARRELPRASRAHPMPPAGSDDFGDYFLLNDLNFRDGRVLFAAHDADDRGAPEIVWELVHGQEAWINQGDSEIYFSQEDAKAARPPGAETP